MCGGKAGRISRNLGLSDGFGDSSNSPGQTPSGSPVALMIPGQICLLLEAIARPQVLEEMKHQGPRNEMDKGGRLNTNVGC